MSPELEALLKADHERHYCEPRERARWQASYERLLADALIKVPGVSRDDFLKALQPRALEYRRAQRKNSSMPTKA